MSTGANFATMLHSDYRGKNKSDDQEEEKKNEEKKEKEIEEGEILCEGCLENQPNQLAHMGFNGCMGKQLEDY